MSKFRNYHQLIFLRKIKYEILSLHNRGRSIFMRPLVLLPSSTWVVLLCRILFVLWNAFVLPKNVSVLMFMTFQVKINGNFSFSFFKVGKGTDMLLFSYLLSAVLHRLTY